MGAVNRQAALLDKKLIPCTLCQERFSLRDVREGRFVAETLICRGCYEKRQKAGFAETCFGKEGGQGWEGYNERALECRGLCPDRNVCRKFVRSGKTQ